MNLVRIDGTWVDPEAVIAVEPSTAFEGGSVIRCVGQVDVRLDHTDPDRVVQHLLAWSKDVVDSGPVWVTGDGERIHLHEHPLLGEATRP